MQESVWIWLFLLEVDSEHGCPFLKVEGYYDHKSKEELVFLIPMSFWPELFLDGPSAHSVTGLFF